MCRLTQPEKDQQDHQYECVRRELQKFKITGGLGRRKNDERTTEMPEDRTNKEREREMGEGRKSEENVLWGIQDDKIGKVQRKESKE